MDTEGDRRALSAEAAKRMYDWVKSTDLTLPDQVALDIGILIGRLSLLEGKGWLDSADAEPPWEKV